MFTQQDIKPLMSLVVPHNRCRFNMRMQLTYCAPVKGSGFWEFKQINKFVD